jgi:malonate-semialdehyde dehydrogenase (acetylating)/methylmalonate-semialdehyde dehydrogenase
MPKTANATAPEETPDALRPAQSSLTIADSPLSVSATPPHAATAASPASLTGASAVVPPSVTYNFVDNELVLSKTRVWTMVHDPVCGPETSLIYYANSVQATQRLLTRVPNSTLVEIQNAVNQAAIAQLSWANVPVGERRSYMLRLLEAVRADSDAMASLFPLLIEVCVKCLF